LCSSARLGIGRRCRSTQRWKPPPRHFMASLPRAGASNCRIRRLVHGRAAGDAPAARLILRALVERPDAAGGGAGPCARLCAHRTGFGARPCRTPARPPCRRPAA
jgi:hypothetical protein